jgi:hypothetical protein
VSVGVGRFVATLDRTRRRFRVALFACRRSR